MSKFSILLLLLASVSINICLAANNDYDEEPGSFEDDMNAEDNAYETAHDVDDDGDPPEDDYTDTAENSADKDDEESSANLAEPASNESDEGPGDDNTTDIATPEEMGSDDSTEVASDGRDDDNTTDTETSQEQGADDSTEAESDGPDDDNTTDTATSEEQSSDDTTEAASGDHIDDPSDDNTSDPATPQKPSSDNSAEPEVVEFKDIVTTDEPSSANSAADESKDDEAEEDVADDIVTTEEAISENSTEPAAGEPKEDTGDNDTSNIGGEGVTDKGTLDSVADLEVTDAEEDKTAIGEENTDKFVTKTQEGETGGSPPPNVPLLIGRMGPIPPDENSGSESALEPVGAGASDPAVTEDSATTQNPSDSGIVIVKGIPPQTDIAKEETPPENAKVPSDNSGATINGTVGASTPEQSSGANIIVGIVVVVILLGAASFGYNCYKKKTYRLANGKMEDIIFSEDEEEGKELQEIVTSNSYNKENGTAKPREDFRKIQEEEPLVEKKQNVLQGNNQNPSPLSATQNSPESTTEKSIKT